MDKDILRAEAPLVANNGFNMVTPRLGAGGHILIYFANSEKVLGTDEWSKYKNDPAGMIKLAIEVYKNNPDFAHIIDMMADRIKPVFDTAKVGGENRFSISGGQTRDWIFSGPVAKRLNIPHITIFKDGSTEYLIPGAERAGTDEAPKFRRFNYHVPDLVTIGSSSYDDRAGKKTGWFPTLWNLNCKANHQMAYFDRLQGGRQNLAKQGIDAHALIYADEAFMDRRFEDGTIKTREEFEEAKKYARDWLGYGENMMLEQGISDFVQFFDPKADPEKVISKGIKFATVAYPDFFENNPKVMEDLEREVFDVYGQRLEQIIETHSR